MWQGYPIPRGTQVSSSGSLSGGAAIPGSHRSRLDSLEQHGEWLGSWGCTDNLGFVLWKEGQDSAATPGLPTCCWRGCRNQEDSRMMVILGHQGSLPHLVMAQLGPLGVSPPLPRSWAVALTVSKSP